KDFRKAIEKFDKVDPGLKRFNADSEARRLTAEGFLARAEKQAREGEYKKAQDDYAHAVKLNSVVDSQFSDQLRNWSVEALLRGADVAAAAGNLDALRDFHDAQSLGAHVDPGAEKRLIQTVAAVRVDEGRSKLDSGDQQAAIALFQEALKLNPA